MMAEFRLERHKNLALFVTEVRCYCFAEFEFHVNAGCNRIDVGLLGRANTISTTHSNVTDGLEKVCDKPSHCLARALLC